MILVCRHLCMALWWNCTLWCEWLVKQTTHLVIQGANQSNQISLSLKYFLRGPVTQILHVRLCLAYFLPSPKMAATGATFITVVWRVLIQTRLACQSSWDQEARKQQTFLNQLEAGHQMIHSLVRNIPQPRGCFRIVSHMMERTAELSGASRYCQLLAAGRGRLVFS